MLTSSLNIKETEMKIVIVRHGETDYNKSKRIQGKQELSLNEKGKTQARQVAESLRQHKITHIYCSSLVRARETAEIINNSFSLPIVTDESLDERDWGTWENRLHDDILKQNPELVDSLFGMGLDANPHEGETARALIKRSVGFLRQTIENHAESDVILVVTHGGPITVMLGFMKDLRLEEYFHQGVENGQILIVEYTNSEFVFE